MGPSHSLSPSTKCTAKQNVSNFMNPTSKKIVFVFKTRIFFSHSLKTKCIKIKRYFCNFYNDSPRTRTQVKREEWIIDLINWIISFCISELEIKTSFYCTIGPLWVMKLHNLNQLFELLRPFFNLDFIITIHLSYKF